MSALITPAGWLGNVKATRTLRFMFTSHDSAGIPTALGGTPAVSVYKDASDTQSTSGVTLSVSADSVTGMNRVLIDLSADGTFYAAGSDFHIVITTGTVGGSSVVGTVIATFSIENRTIAGQGGTIDGTVSIQGSNDAAALSLTGGTASVNDGVSGAGLAITGGFNGPSVSLQGADFDVTPPEVVRIANGNGGGGVTIIAAGNGHALSLTGSGTGNGVSATGGSTGHGVKFTGGASGGNGLYVSGVASSVSGAVFTSDSGSGVEMNGSTSLSGTGVGLSATSGTNHAIYGTAGGSGHGAAFVGGSSGGSGAEFLAGGASSGGGGSGIYVQGTVNGIHAVSGTNVNAAGLKCSGNGDAFGFYVVGGADAPSGAKIEAAGSDHNGLTLAATGTGNDFNMSTPSSNLPVSATVDFDDLLDLADGIETDLTMREGLRLMVAALAGKLSGANGGATTIVIRNIGDTLDRMSATVDEYGNRTAVTNNLS